jgi:hypothetical protein
LFAVVANTFDLNARSFEEDGFANPGRLCGRLAGSSREQRDNQNRTRDGDHEKLLQFQLEFATVFIDLTRRLARGQYENLAEARALWGMQSPTSSSAANAFPL